MLAVKTCAHFELGAARKRKAKGSKLHNHVTSESGGQVCHKQTKTQTASNSTETQPENSGQGSNQTYRSFSCRTFLIFLFLFLLSEFATHIRLIKEAHLSQCNEGIRS